MANPNASKTHAPANNKPTPVEARIPAQAKPDPKQTGILSIPRVTHQLGDKVRVGAIEAEVTMACEGLLGGLYQIELPDGTKKMVPANELTKIT